MSPYKPILTLESSFPLTAVVMHTRSPQTIGLEVPSPSSAVRHRSPCFFETSHVVNVGKPSATPPALMPRNDGQSDPGFGSADRRADVVLNRMRRNRIARRLEVMECLRIRRSVAHSMGKTARQV